MILSESKQLPSPTSRVVEMGEVLVSMTRGRRDLKSGVHLPTEMLREMV